MIFDLGASSGLDIASDEDVHVRSGLHVRQAEAKAVLSRREPLITTDHIVIETWTLIRHRLGRRPAERFWEGIRLGAATVEPVGMADMDSASEIGKSDRATRAAGRDENEKQIPSATVASLQLVLLQ